MCIRDSSTTDRRKAFSQPGGQLRPFQTFSKKQRCMERVIENYARLIKDNPLLFAYQQRAVQKT
eukprot:12006798-Alexandrium_andersonii.AAC.1